MYAYVTNRSRIADLLSGRRGSLPTIEIQRPEDIPPLDSQAAAAVWSQDPAHTTELPELLLAPDGLERDWVAWLVTYAPQVRPFTAYCRVGTRTNFLARSALLQKPSLGGLDAACLGLILGEVLTSDDGATRMRDAPSVAACASVLAFALVRDIALHRALTLESDDLPERWVAVRRLTRQRERGLAPRHVASVAEVLRALLHGRADPRVSSVVYRSCEEIIERRELLTGAALLGPAFERALDGLGDGTREDRVAAFERALTEPLAAEGSMEEAFALGYLASRINPGTLTHAALLVPALDRSPSALLWYGVCAGLHPDNKLEAEFGGVGRRALRDILSSDALVGRPRADVSFMELQALLVGERPEEFPAGSPSQLHVELAPAIWSAVNWSSRSRSTSIHDPGVASAERLWISSELGDAITRLADLHRRIERPDLRERGSTQPGLFERRPDRRGGKKR